LSPRPASLDRGKNGFIATVPFDGLAFSSEKLPFESLHHGKVWPEKPRFCLVVSYFEFALEALRNFVSISICWSRHASFCLARMSTRHAKHSSHTHEVAEAASKEATSFDDLLQNVQCKSGVFVIYAYLLDIILGKLYLCVSYSLPFRQYNIHMPEGSGFQISK
jgi:hypothetical protein